MSTVPERPRGQPETLSVREGRRPAQGRPHEGVPPHLERPLRDWLRSGLTADLERDIALRLEVRLSPRGRIPRSTDPSSSLADHPDVDLLDAVELVLQLSPQIAQELAEIDDDAEQVRAIEGTDVTFMGPESVDELDHLLEVGNSVYRVGRHARPLLLIRRLDPTVQATFERAVHDSNTATELLARAWSKAYGRQPDPDGAHHDAVRAVEALAGPLVLPTSTRRTLNQVAQHLRDDSQRPDPSRRKWELVITKLGEGTVEPLVAMFDRLWHGNLASRHGDLEAGYREVTLDEARAGVQLAVLLVQWLTDGVLRRRDASSLP